MSHRYAPYYCEENVWWLLKDGALHDGHAVFISNLDGSVALWSQQASERPDGLVLWDYHVVALGRVDDRWLIADLDCTAGQSLPVADWVAVTFPFTGAVPEDVEPLFRVVPAPDLFERFRTDRSHMRAADGSWLAPPPPWEPLADTSNITDYWSMVEGPGEVLDLDALLRRFR